MGFAFDLTSTDTYQELPCPGTQEVTVQISNAAISIGFGQGGDGRPGTATYGQDEALLPVVGGLERECDAIRLKSYAAGNPADVKISCR